ncbi:MAG: hypothetical protein M0R80_23645 [Proteobacteria bacterium]|jgi:hypothetical protein|nr:hypothetical protein [Pseudomonadota bacterium]
MFVAQIRDNLLGQVNAVDTIEEGIELVKKIVIENGVTVTEEIMTEIEEDWSYLSEEGDWSVCIGQTEED